MSALESRSKTVFDRVALRWTLGRLRNRWPGAEAFTAHRPPYLAEPPQPSSPHDPAFPALPEGGRPQGRLILPLPGHRIDLTADEASNLYAGQADDLSLRSLHRFAWLPFHTEVEDDWVTLLWGSWLDRHANPDPDSAAWVPLTAARRVLNLLDFAGQRGLPGPRQRTLASLAAHGSYIAEQLDYWGDAGTDHRLAVEGLALVRLGLETRQEAFATAGLTIMIEEAKRLFGVSGLLREGSTHYHLLIARDYIDGWLAARRHDRPEAPALEQVVRKLLGAIPALTLTGGLPLVGDIGPNSPPSYLAGLLAGGDLSQGWTGQLAEADRQALGRLRDDSACVDLELLRADGWLRQDIGPWSGLWHGTPGGWDPVPGHAHQDLGGFELHYEGVPVFVDPGCGVGGEEAKIYASAAAHNGLEINGKNPYPRNRSAYSEAFRREIAGPAPVLQAEHDGASLSFQGYSRSLGHNEVKRRWRFEGSSFVIDDMINGTGRVSMARRLVTPLPVEILGGDAFINGPDWRLKVSADLPAELHPGKLWTAWGEFRPAQAITFLRQGNLPWRGRISVELA